MTAEKEGSWDALIKKHALWLQSFWFVRGVMGTMALIALIPQVTELEQIEVLRALYALIIGWNDVAAWIGRMIGQLPFIPELSEHFVTAFVFTVSIPVPIVFSIFQKESAISDPVVRVCFSGFMLGLLPLLHNEISSGSGLAAIPTIDDDFSVLAFVGLVLLVIALVFGFWNALRIVPGLKSGFYFTLGVIATITVGYNIGTTEFSDWINATVCAELHIAPEDCSPDNS